MRGISCTPATGGAVAHAAPLCRLQPVPARPWRLLKPVTLLSRCQSITTRRAARTEGGARVQSFFGWGSSTAQDEDYYDDRVTVAKVQVGLLAPARKVQQQLERIAARADTDSSEGLHYLVKEAALALLRAPDFCAYGFSEGAICADDSRAEQRFNKYSLEERSKVKREGRLDVGGWARRAFRKGPAADPQQLMVVTILVAAEGAFTLPKVTSWGELREALSELGALPRDSFIAAEVLWTPEDGGEYITTDDLAADYPLLNTL